MKIAHISFSLMNGGKENMMVDIVNEQRKLGHDLAVIIINNKIDQAIIKRLDPAVRVFKLNRKPGSKSPVFLIRLLMVIKYQFKPTVIHAHDVQIGGLVKKLSKAKTVLTVHGPGIEVEPMKKFDKIYYISESVKQDVENQIDLKGKVIYNGIYTEQIKQKKSFPENKVFRMAHVKRLTHERKGQDILIKAMNELVNKKSYTNIRLDLVGGGDSFDFLENMITEFSLENEVRLLGMKDREWIYEHLCDYDIFVHPSRFEGFGLTVVEAMAARVPVISSNIEGPAEILEDGKYGFLFKNGDITSLVSEIEEVMKLYENNSIKEVVDSAFDHCEKHFDISCTAKNYCTAYPF